MTQIKITPLAGVIEYLTCAKRWDLISPSDALPPLIALALALDKDYDPDIWNFQCKEHQQYFRVGLACPSERLNIPAEEIRLLYER